MLARTTADFLTAVKAGTAAPVANGLVTDPEILGFADEEMESEIAALLISLRSEYWLRTYETTISAGTASYRLPDRSLGMGAREVTIYDASGSEWNATQISAERRYLFAGRTWTRSGPFAFTLENGTLTLLPTPTVAGYSLRVRYYTSPSRLVETDECATVTTGTMSGTTIACSAALPANLVAGVYIDVIRGAGMCEALDIDRQIDSVSSPTITLEAATPITLTASDRTRLDYVAEAGKTPVVPVPDALWPVLVHATKRAYCEAIGDSRGMEAAAAMFDRRKRMALEFMAPRVDGEQRRPVPIGTPLRAGRGWR